MFIPCQSWMTSAIPRRNIYIITSIIFKWVHEPTMPNKSSNMYIYILWCFNILFMYIYIYTYTNKIQTSSINVYSILICHTSHGQSAEWELFRPGLSQKFWRMFTKISVQYDIINQFHGVWEPQICQCFQRWKLKIRGECLREVFIAAFRLFIPLK